MLSSPTFHWKHPLAVASAPLLHGSCSASVFFPLEMSNTLLSPEIGELGYTSLSLPTCLVQVFSREFGACASGDFWATFPPNFRKKNGKQASYAQFTIHPKKHTELPLIERLLRAGKPRLQQFLSTLFLFDCCAQTCEDGREEARGRSPSAVFLFPSDFSVEVKLACLLWAKVIFVEYSPHEKKTHEQQSKHHAFIIWMKRWHFTHLASGTFLGIR